MTRLCSRSAFCIASVRRPVRPIPTSAKSFLRSSPLAPALPAPKWPESLLSGSPFLCHQFEIKREEVTLYMADLLDRVVPTMPPKYCMRCHGRLTKMGVTIMLKNNVVEIGKDFIILQEGDVQQRIESSTIIWAAGTDGASIAQKAAKTLPGTRRARLESDKFLRSKTDTSVYLVGDVLHYVPEGEEAPVPQVVENAEYSAECAAHNILVETHRRGRDGSLFTKAARRYGVRGRPLGQRVCRHPQA